jgi:hypothetical protein
MVEAAIKERALREAQATARARALEDVYEKLINGTLIAKGFRHPIRSTTMEREIPAAHWRIIRFNGDFTEARSQNASLGIQYSGITVARA